MYSERPCSFCLILWVFDGIVTQWSQKSSCRGHFYHCFYLERVGWAQRNVFGSSPKIDTVDLTFLAPVSGSTHAASWPSQFTGEESSADFSNPSQQLLTPSAPYPIRWGKQKTPFFPWMFLLEKDAWQVDGPWSWYVSHVKRLICLSHFCEKFQSEKQRVINLKLGLWHGTQD